jgi:hypothetical protein
LRSLSSRDRDHNKLPIGDFFYSLPVNSQFSQQFVKAVYDRHKSRLIRSKPSPDPRRRPPCLALSLEWHKISRPWHPDAILPLSRSGQKQYFAGIRVRVANKYGRRDEAYTRGSGVRIMMRIAMELSTPINRIRGVGEESCQGARAGRSCAHSSDRAGQEGRMCGSGDGFDRIHLDLCRS